MNELNQKIESLDAFGMKFRDPQLRNQFLTRLSRFKFLLTYDWIPHI